MNRQLLLDAVAAVLVAGVIGGLAYPFAQHKLMAARQAEAKNNLILVHTLEESYARAQGTYRAFAGVGPDGGKAPKCGDEELGFKLGACDRARYTYSATVAGSGDQKRFVAVAKAPAGAIVPDCEVADAWRIDQGRQLRALKGRDAVEACRK